MRPRSGYLRKYTSLSFTNINKMPPLCVEQALEKQTVQCVNTGHILKRMKGLKKIKRKMGLSARWNQALIPSTPISFHNVCGSNVSVYNEGKTIRRTQSFCHAIAFSNRPIKMCERVYIRLLEVASNWSGILRFGFTSVDPICMGDNLPKYVCPDLTNRNGYWAKALHEKYAKQGSVLSFYYNSMGEIIFEIDQVEQGVFLKGITASSNLWVVIDVYGNTTALQFINPSSLLNNNSNNQQAVVETPTSYVRRTPHALSNRNLPVQPSVPYRSNNQAEESVLIPGFGNMSICDPNMMRVLKQHTENNALPLVIYKDVSFNPMSFHSTKGNSVKFHDHNRTVAWRQINKFSQGYVFTGRPLTKNEKMVVQVLSVEEQLVGSMAFGVTSANPASLNPAALPDDSDELLDRSEYWVVCKNVASAPKAGDELSFTYTSSGQITYARNNEASHVIMHVDTSLNLFAFFDIFGCTTRLRILGTVPLGDPMRNLLQQQISLQNRVQQDPSLLLERNNIAAQRTMSAPRGSSIRYNNLSSAAPNRPCAPDTTQPFRAANPPYKPPTAESRFRPNICVNEAQFRSSPMITEPSNDVSFRSTPMITGDANKGGGKSEDERNECSVCYERRIDSVLYSCGHMCMCYECAMVQWHGRAGHPGACPICRAPIKDVIRTYRS